MPRRRHASGGAAVSMLNAGLRRAAQTDAMKRTRPTAGKKEPTKVRGRAAVRLKPLRRRGPARSIAEHAADSGVDEGFVEHPDGWYWVAPDGRQQFGPFETCSLARADRDRVSEESVNEAEAEREAERELGVEDAVRDDVAPPRDGDEMGEGVEGRGP